MTVPPDFCPEDFMKKILKSSSLSMTGSIRLALTGSEIDRMPAGDVLATGQPLALGTSLGVSVFPDAVP
jgi:hypothetical protein